jgi:hypothetical protein
MDHLDPAGTPAGSASYSASLMVFGNPMSGMTLIGSLLFVALVLRQPSVLHT